MSEIERFRSGILRIALLGREADRLDVQSQREAGIFAWPNRASELREKASALRAERARLLRELEALALEGATVAELDAMIIDATRELVRAIEERRQ